MNANDVVKVASGPLVLIEMWQQALRDAGIDGKVVGTDLSGGFGSAMPNSVELWVNQADEAKARAAIERAEQEKGTNPEGPRHHHGVPESDPKHKGPEGDHFPGGGKFNTGPRGK